MSSEWTDCCLADVADLTGGHAFKSSQYIEDGIFVLRTLNIESGGSINPEDAVFVSNSDAEEFKRFELFDGDILFVMVGATLGKVGRVGKEVLPALLNQNMWKIRAKDSLADQDFLYFCFKHNVSDIIGWASGSARGFLRRDDCRNLSISLPPLKEQKAIAHILGTLDEKIELNRKTSETLEGIAKALFRSWFVDFDPVRAKAEGRPTGLPDEVSELFPDSFEESELGEIPSGWNVGEVQDLCEWVSSGGTPARSNKEFWDDGDIPWFKTGELNDGPLLDSAEKINELAVNNSSCKLWEKGTILFAIYASPTVGRLGVLTSRGTSNQAAAGLMASKSIGTPFLRRCLLFSRNDLQNIAVGAAQQNINVKILKEHKIVIPPESLAGRFSDLVGDFDDRQEVLLKEVSLLEQLRDALLPKLISGELRVPDAEKMLEEVDI